MDLPLERVADAAVVEEPRRDGAIEGPASPSSGRPPNNGAASATTIGVDFGRADHRPADRTLGVEEHGADRMRVFARLAAELVEAPAPARATAAARRIASSSSPGASAVSNAPAMKRSTGRRRWPAGPRTIGLGAERGERRDPVRGRIGMGEAAADRAAVAHGAIGDRARDLGQGAVGGIGHAAVLDVGVGDAGADQQAIVLGSARSSSGTAVMSTSRSGCARRRLSIGPSDWPPASGFTALLARSSAIASARLEGRA